MVVTHQKGEVEIIVSGLLPKNFKLIGSQRHESFQHVSQQNLDLRTLFNRNRDAHTVDTGLYQAVLSLAL